MENRIEEIRLNPIEYDQYKGDWRNYFIQYRSAKAADLKEVRLLKKSLDARKKEIKFNLRFELVYQDAPQSNPSIYPKIGERMVHIIGFGPAGIFAALELLKIGIKPVVIERGKAVKDRRRDVAQLNRAGEMDPESNYCFGEGGAGTFSDGKLYTRSHKRGKIKDVLQTLIDHGAEEDISFEAHPHIGTNKLPGIIEAMRNTIVEHGGEVRFSAKLTDIDIANGQVNAVKINDEWEDAQAVILATGHSARDIYELLYEKGVKLEAKPFAMGYRIEHPQELLNQIQYHNSRYMPYLPPASYSVVEQVRGKGVFSFCMCPGGIIAPAATAEGEVVTNGWSPSKRNGAYANSGWVTEIGPEEWKAFDSEGPLAGLRFQQSIERRAHDMAGGGFKVPAQNLKDFLAQRTSKQLNASSYHPGMVSVDLNLLYPEHIAYRLREGLRQACNKMKGFDHEKAMVVGPESRTSSPVRIPREKDLQHPEIKGLYPCGEGAGYAGGILSAAMDGVRVVKAISGVSI